MIAAGASSRADEYKGGVTFYVAMSCIVGACTGLVFGYGEWQCLTVTANGASRPDTLTHFDRLN